MSQTQTPQDPVPSMPPSDPALVAARRRLEAQYPPPIVDTLTQSEVLALSPEALVVIAGGPNCDIRGANTLKKVPNNAEGMGFAVRMMPHLVDASTGRWSPTLDADCDGTVEHHEIQAGLIRGAQIAYERGIPLGAVRMEYMTKEQIAPIANRLSGNDPETCVTPPRTPSATPTPDQRQGR